MPSLFSLETLTIDYHSSSKVTDATLQYLPRYCLDITKLGFVPTSSFRGRFIDSIIQTFDGLCEIEFYLTYNNLHRAIFKSLFNCPSLTHLVLKTNYEELSGISFLSQSMVMDLMALNRLESVSFISWLMTSTLNRGFSILQNGHHTDPRPFLSSLYIDCGGFSLGDDIMVPFIESRPHLKCLLLFNTRFSDFTLNKIGTYLPGLIYLKLHGNYVITDNGVYYLICCCHELKQVDFPNCFRVLGHMVEFVG